MKRIINRAALAKTTFNSNHVGVLSYHALQVKEAGAYLGHVLYKDKVVATINIDSSEGYGNMQANIDFLQFTKERIGHTSEETIRIQPEGYLVLINSSGDTPYRFQLLKVGKKPGGDVIADTYKLGQGAVYACTLLIPGSYTLRHNGKNTTMIRVEYPTTQTDRKRLQEPVRIKVGGKQDYKKEISVLPMQGLVFEFETEGSIEISLKEADKDKGLLQKQILEAQKSRKGTKNKKPTTKKTYKWRNPKYPQPN